jgi:two-component system copper resistance phosphate regulon response regulator CusR
MKILVVQADQTSARYVVKGLKEEGYVVDVAFDGIDGIHLATTVSYDAIVLDVALPGTDGWSALREIRRTSDSPVIFLTSQGEVSDRVKGLELGADDCLPKPFAFSELLARIRAVMRRSRMASPDVRIKVADLELDILSRRSSRAGRPLRLTKQEFALLECLARSSGRPVSRTLISERVWNVRFDSHTNVIDVAVRRLRAKLDDDHEAKLIRTVRGVGYSFSQSRASE